MKRALSILLTLLLALALLPAGAMAAQVVASPQNLRVDGRAVDCEKYNIDGSNYFKLRDVAMLLNGTGSRFSVGWDGEKNLISIVTGEDYVPNGSELDLSGGDKSATAVPSAQTLTVNGVERTDLSAYNIGGNNYFRLRDLGSALGFAVDYDGETNSAIVISRAMSVPQPWSVEETFRTDNSGGSEHSVSTYDADGRPISEYHDYGNYTERTDWFYNELGREVERIYAYRSEYEDGAWERTSDTTTEYDKWGLPVKKTTVEIVNGEEEDVTVETIVYDDQARVLTDETVNSYGSSRYAYDYDERGFEIRRESRYSSGDCYIVEYLRDEDGRILLETGLNEDGSVRYTNEYEYENGLLTLNTYRSGTYFYTTYYTYDAEGRLLRRWTESTDWDNSTENTYDAEGQLVKSVYYDGADLFTTPYDYDGEGRVLRMGYESPDGDWLTEYTYDAEGNVLTETASGDYTTRTEYTYDPAEGRQTAVTTVTYPMPTGIELSPEELEMAVGDVYSLYYNFTPLYSAAVELVWSSSNEDVVRVDDSGCLEAVGPGEAVVTAVAESGASAQCAVTVAADKYTLTVSPYDFPLEPDELMAVRCTVRSVGTPGQYSLSFGSYDDSVVYVYWGDWLESGVIDLYVLGLAAGETEIPVFVKDYAGQPATPTQYIAVTVGSRTGNGGGSVPIPQG